MISLRRALAFLGVTSPAAGFSTIGPMPVDQAVAEFFNRNGVSVSRDQALSVPAMLRGRNLICSIATLPLVQRNARRQPVDNPMLRQFDPNIANVVHLAQTIEDLVFEAIAWWRVTSLAWTGYPYSVERVDPRSVSLKPPVGRELAPLPSGWDPREAAVWVDGKPVPASQMKRFDSPNPGVLANGGRALRRALAFDQAAAMFADNPRAQGYFQAKDQGGDPADPMKVKRILNDWKAARKVRADGYVPSWLEYHDASSPTPADLQLVQLIQQATLEIANMLGLDPEELGVSTTSRTYANVTDRRKDKINDVFGSYMRAITDRLSMPDMTPAGNAVQFDLDDYLKPDPMTRWQVYEIQERMGATDVEEIRAREGWEDRQIDAPAADPVSEAEAVVAAALAGHRFTFDRPAALTFVDLPCEDFAVDASKRTISGTILPYGRVAKGFEFAPGSLEWMADDTSRVKMLRDHDAREAAGYAQSIKTSSGKVAAVFKIGRGPKGDAALQDAEDKIADGFSVGVDFDLEADTVPHPRKKGVILVRRATLREVSLTALPSFDDARVTSVAASLTGGTMPCSMCGHVHADGVACSTPPAVQPAPASPAPGPALPPELAAAFAQFSGAAQQQPVQPALPPGPAVQLTPNGAQPSPLAAAFAQFLQSTGAPVAVAGPGHVNPTAAPLPAAVVAEPAPYRFDRRGNLCAGTHDFGADFINGVRNKDAEAYNRVMKFAADQLSETFDVVTTDVNELNPTRNRPELYVDQRSFRYPIWDSIDKGTLTDITPFTFPKFNSAGTLVGAHTEGTEPSSGTFTLTGQTVTPTAKSGKIKISRETWDQGGNPQVGNLIWRQMVKAWFEMLEAAAVTMLDAASPASLGTFTVGGGTTGQTLARELKRYMSALHFVRGGFSMTDAMTQIDLYQHLVGAEDDTGRSLFPAIGPSNADGTVDNRWQSIDVNGVKFNPAWALAATGAVPASSYLYDRDSVHGWASAPRQLTIDEIEVANVYIGLWGYVATAISDINGVREIIYDPA